MENWIKLGTRCRDGSRLHSSIKTVIKRNSDTFFLIYIEYIEIANFRPDFGLENAKKLLYHLPLDWFREL